jgi:SAM-dependent methyltransferase
VIREQSGDDWESHWTRYAAVAGLNPAQHLRHAAIMKALKREHLPVARLLDIGSGQGDFLARAAAEKAAGVYAGFELSAAGVNVSRAKAPQAQFFQVDILAPPPDAERFAGWATAAVCSEVVEHVDDPVAFLSALRTYLAVDATLVLTVPGGPVSKFDRHIGHRGHFTKARARQILSDAGFRVDTVRLVGFPFFNLYRLMVILRGQQLVDDAESQTETAATGLARLAMHAFGFLFNFTLEDFPLGWQVVAIAKNSPTRT